MEGGKGGGGGWTTAEESKGRGVGKVGVISRAPPGVRSRDSHSILHNGGTVGLLKAGVCHELPCVCVGVGVGVGKCV